MQIQDPPQSKAAGFHPEALRHVASDCTTDQTGQTPGMLRREGISGLQTGSRELWMGETRVAPGTASADHHHGHSETGIYVVAGHPQFVFLEGGDAGPREVRLHTSPGDYIYVPPFAPHREENPDPEETAVVVIARTTQQAVIVNLEALTIPDPPPSRRWAPNGAVTTRGTVVIVPGRGEHPGVYDRLGRRLAYDGYVAVAIPAPDSVESAEEAIAAAAATETAPIVLVGSDTGALAALAAAVRQRVDVDGVVAAGTPAGAGVTAGDRDRELDLRTACPVHRGRLTVDAGFRWGALDRPSAIEALAGAAVDPPVVPVLFVHGGADAVSPAAAARHWAVAYETADWAVIQDGRHDILNDLDHRVVAARIVTFLERVKKGTRR